MIWYIILNIWYDEIYADEIGQKICLRFPSIPVTFFYYSKQYDKNLE